MHRRTAFLTRLVAPLPFLLGGALAAGAQSSPAVLRVEVFASQREDAFFVTSALVVGPTEAILWDAQYKPGDARRLADLIAGTGRSLKAIVISHADHDHVMGALELVRRFPGTPVFMTRSGLEDFDARAAKDLELERRRPGSEAPDSLVRPQRLSGPLTVDGVPLEVLEDVAADVRVPASAVLWIPSLRTALVGDLAFDGIHPWLGDADLASRERWRASLRRVQALGPERVVPGHQTDLATQHGAGILRAMEEYLTAFDSLMASAAAPPDLIRAMTARYPGLRLPVLMSVGARAHFKR